MTIAAIDQSRCHDVIAWDLGQKDKQTSVAKFTSYVRLWAFFSEVTYNFTELMDVFFWASSPWYQIVPIRLLLVPKNCIGTTVSFMWYQIMRHCGCLPYTQIWSRIHSQMSYIMSSCPGGTLDNICYLSPNNVVSEPSNTGYENQSPWQP